MTKHALKLTYFDMHGGRGEVARLAMHMGGIEFRDERIGFKDWPGVKPTTPFGAIPVLEVDGRTLTQSNTINRFVGKLAGLYPDDPWQAALCDEVMGVVEDISHQVVATLGLKDQVKLKAARQALADGPIKFYASRLDALLADRGGEYFADNRLTVADLKVFVWTRHMRSGRLDHIPIDLVDSVAPLLVKHLERVDSHPTIKAYYDSRGGY